MSTPDNPSAEPTVAGAEDGSRRKLLTAIAGAGAAVTIAHRALASGWNRPVVDSIVLPAHADTTPLDVVLEGKVEIGIPVTDATDESMLDWLLPMAHAGENNINGFVVDNVCVEVSAGNVVLAIATMFVPVYPPGCEFEEIGLEVIPLSDRSRPSQRLADFFVEPSHAGNNEICQGPFVICGSGIGTVGSFISLNPNGGLNTEVRVNSVSGTAPNRIASITYRRPVFPGDNVQTVNTVIFEGAGNCACKKNGGRF